MHKINYKHLKIVLTGPESSGKTTLAEQLSQHLNAPLVPEYARHFFNHKKNTDYVFADLTTIAKGQCRAEQRALRSNAPIVVLDTDLVTIKIWSEEVFGRTDDWILEKLKSPDSGYITHYFLCSPDGIEWEADPLRENPHNRARLFDVYEKELIKHQKSYSILRGGYERRLKDSLAVIFKKI